MQNCASECLHKTINYFSHSKSMQCNWVWSYFNDCMWNKFPSNKAHICPSPPCQIFKQLCRTWPQSEPQPNSQMSFTWPHTPLWLWSSFTITLSANFPVHLFLPERQFVRCRKEKEEKRYEQRFWECGWERLVKQEIERVRWCRLKEEIRDATERKIQGWQQFGKGRQRTTLRKLSLLFY